MIFWRSCLSLPLSSTPLSDRQLSGAAPTTDLTLYCPLKPYQYFFKLYSLTSPLSPNNVLPRETRSFRFNCNWDFIFFLDSFGQQPLDSLDIICCCGATSSDYKALKLPITDHFFISCIIQLPLTIPVLLVSSPSAILRKLTWILSPLLWVHFFTVVSPGELVTQNYFHFCSILD